MRPLIKLYLKTFLYTGIPFGIIMTAFDLAQGHAFELWKFLFLTFFFGITMSLTLVTFHKHRLRKYGITEMSDDNLRVNQTKSIHSSLDKTELLAKLKSDPIIGKMKMTEVDNGIRITTNATWKSWGEEINILQAPVKGPEFEYQVKSIPKVKMTLLDYGKNLENVNLIEKAIASFA